MVWIESEIVLAKGHPNITARHKSTLEITKDNFLSKRGDCIIGINANKSVKDFNKNFKDILKKDNTIVIILLNIENIFDIVIGKGSSRLILSNEKSIVIRKSNFIDNRTVAISANKSAIDIDRKIINMLKKGGRLKVLFIGINEMGPEGIEPSSSPREGDVIPLDYGQDKLI